MDTLWLINTIWGIHAREDNKTNCHRSEVNKSFHTGTNSKYSSCRAYILGQSSWLCHYSLKVSGEDTERTGERGCAPNVISEMGGRSQLARAVSFAVDGCQSSYCPCVYCIDQEDPILCAMIGHQVHAALSCRKPKPQVRTLDLTVDPAAGLPFWVPQSPWGQARGSSSARSVVPIISEPSQDPLDHTCFSLNSLSTKCQPCCSAVEQALPWGTVIVICCYFTFLHV